MKQQSLEQMQKGNSSEVMASHFQKEKHEIELKLSRTLEDLVKAKSNHEREIDSLNAQLASLRRDIETIAKGSVS